MAVRANEWLFRALSELRYQPTEKWLRATLGGDLVADTRRGLLVWEPGRIAPSYGVPEGDVSAELRPAAADRPVPPNEPTSIPGGPRILGPERSFDLHSSPGEAFDVVVAGTTRVAAAFRPADADLDGYIVLDFAAFDWREEDDVVFSHARDPYHRVDIRPSSRHVRIERDGQPLAETSRPVLVFETSLPVRFYLPPEDVRTDFLRVSDTSTACPYKGVASYLAADSASGLEDVAWSYQSPVPDAAELAGLIAFFDEHVDVTVDGVLRERPVTPWSKRPATESA